MGVKNKMIVEADIADDFSEAAGGEAQSSQPDASENIFMHTGYQVRLDQYMVKAAAANAMSLHRCLMVNLMQSPTRRAHAATFSGMAPALLRGSVLSDLVSGKATMPFQHWLIMGWPLPG